MNPNMTIKNNIIKKQLKIIKMIKKKSLRKFIKMFLLNIYMIQKKIIITIFHSILLIEIIMIFKKEQNILIIIIILKAII